MPILKSTKTRLTFWYIGVLALILVLCTGAIYLFVEAVLRDQIDNTLSDIAASFENTANLELEDEDQKTKTESIDGAVRDAAIEVSFANYKIFIFSPDKRLVAETKSTELDEEVSLATAHKWLNRFTSKIESNRDEFGNDDETYRLHFHPFSIQGERFYLIAVHPLEETEEILERIRYAFLIVLPLALLLASFGGFMLMKKSFAPITEMNEKAEEITAKNLHERLPVEDENEELGKLARTFNRLLERLDNSFDLQQRFMADASHELRTPVAIVRGEAEVSLTKDDRSSADYRETIGIMQKEAERMSRIVEDLFTLARADSSADTIIRSTVYLDEILVDTQTSFRSIALKRNIRLELDITEEMPINGDEQLLKRLFANLLDNAIVHANSFVRLEAVVEKGYYRINVADDGNGIPSEKQPFIFERFYRVDKTRSPQSELSAGSGAGLGLAICKWIADVHNGTIELTDSSPGGSTFSVTFPVS